MKSYQVALSDAAAAALPKDFISILDFAPDGLRACLDLAAAMKAARHQGIPQARPLEGRHVALLFEKPSLRTRSTFTIAVRQLGGDVIEPPADVALGGRESLADVARNLERWVAGCVVRTYEQARLIEFAEAAPRMHIVNALTNEEHPCQAIADMLASTCASDRRTATGCPSPSRPPRARPPRAGPGSR
jgi:ornithine carbamoyltransferase